MNTNFNHEQSLSLINEMINRARNNFQKGSTDTMIFWGYLVAVAAMANFVLLNILNNPNQSYMVWLLMVPGAVVSYFMERRIDRAALVKTHIDKIVGAIWNGFSISIAVLLIIIFAKAFMLKMPAMLLLITPVIMVMVGLAEFATAVACKHKPMYYIAVLFWVSAIVCAFLPQDLAYVVLAVCMILGFVVPGHILNYKNAKK